MVALHKSVGIRKCALLTAGLEHTAIQILHTSRYLTWISISFSVPNFHTTDGRKEETECLVSPRRNITNDVTF